MQIILIYSCWVITVNVFFLAICFCNDQLRNNSSLPSSLLYRSSSVSPPRTRVGMEESNRIISLTSLFARSSSMCAAEHTEQPRLSVWCPQRYLAVNRLRSSLPCLSGEQQRSCQHLRNGQASLRSAQHAVRSYPQSYSCGPR